MNPTTVPRGGEEVRPLVVAFFLVALTMMIVLCISLAFASLSNPNPFAAAGFGAWFLVFATFLMLMWAAVFLLARMTFEQNDNITHGYFLGRFSTSFQSFSIFLPFSTSNDMILQAQRRVLVVNSTPISLSLFITFSPTSSIL